MRYLLSRTISFTTDTTEYPPCERWRVFRASMTTTSSLESARQGSSRDGLTFPNTRRSGMPSLRAARATSVGSRTYNTRL